MTPLSPDCQRALDALQAAVTEALERKRRLGQYAVFWQDGRPVRVIPGETEPAQPQTGNRPIAK